MRSTGLAFLGDMQNLTRKTLYVVPHQDDELFTFGLDVVKTLSRGDSVYVLLVTDGSECWVKDMLADGKKCTDGGKDFHDCHKYALSTEEFVASRDKEFFECCSRLGINKDNVHLSNPRFVDMNFSVEEVKAAIKSVVEMINPDRVCVHAPRWESSFNPCERNVSMPPHIDHCFCGRAVYLLLREKVIKDAEFFIEFYDLERFESLHSDITVRRIEANSDEAELIQRAGLAYKVWNPDEGRYAIGWHCDKEMHSNALKKPVSLSYKIPITRLFASRVKHKLFVK